MTRRDIDKLNVVVDALVSVIMNHASSAERNKVAYMRNHASSAERNEVAYMREDRREYRPTKASLESRIGEEARGTMSGAERNRVAYMREDRREY